VLCERPAVHYGRPATWYGWNDSDKPVFESQTRYLARHNLLTKLEQRLLGDFDFTHNETLRLYDSSDLQRKTIATDACWPSEDCFLRDEQIQRRVPKARRQLGHVEFDQDIGPF
jgi:hypothetical protein